MENIRFRIQILIAKDRAPVKNQITKSTDFYVRYDLSKNLNRFITRRICWNISNVIRRELKHEIN